MSDERHKNNFAFSIIIFLIITVVGSDSFESYYVVAWADYGNNYFIVQTVVSLNIQESMVCRAFFFNNWRGIALIKLFPIQTLRLF